MKTKLTMFVILAAWLFSSWTSFAGTPAAVAAPLGERPSAAVPSVALESLIALDDGRAEALGADGASHDGVGATVAIDGDIAVVGAPIDSVGNPYFQGSAYVFVREATGWRLEAKLTASDQYSQDRFGAAVAISGETIVVGAFAHDADGVFAKGAAYVYVRSGGTWSQQARLTPADGIAQMAFGAAVAVSGDTALVSAPGIEGGGVYEFARRGSTWVQRAKISAEPGDPAGTPGWSLAFSTALRP